MSNILYLQIEAVGCQTSCRHCYAGGSHYKSMPIDQVRQVMAGSARCARWKEWPSIRNVFHELLAHPDEDWKELLAALKAVGTRRLWVSFHGVEEVHDRMVNRPGAYDELLLPSKEQAQWGLIAGPTCL